VVQDYAERLEDCSHGRANAQALVEAFSRKLKNVQIESMLFSQSHADMTCDNALYSYDNKVCIIDIKTRLAPIYSDLGLILIHPETFKPQIFSGGTYLSESILKVYRDAILKGYFGDELQDEYLVQIYSAIKVLDKWTMYEELMSRYKGLKHLLAVPVGPFVTTYFQSVLKKHLNAIQGSDMQQEFKIAKPADPAV
jgi:thiamine kinase-like enzyme